MEDITAVTVVEKKMGAHTLRLETGKVAKQAHGAVTVQYGDTIVLATALSAPPTRDIDYFPLYVDYREMQYAGGKFPGGFFKREGRPSSKEVLSCRMVDRTIRPLWPDGYSNEVQIQCIVVSSDKECDPDVLAVIGGSAALALSPAPFEGPIAAVRVGKDNDEFVLFPTYEQRREGGLDLIVAGHGKGINMLEMGGEEVPEDVVAEACEFGFKWVKEIVGMIDELTAKVGVKKDYEPPAPNEELNRLVADKCGKPLAKAKQTKGKAEREEALREIRESLLAELCPEGAEEPPYERADVGKAFHDLEHKIQRELAMSGVRPDGRSAKDIRPITIEVPALPRTHGSALFTRGETQSLAAVTLGTPRDQQKIDGLVEEYYKRFILHYNFPPFSVGEIRPIRGPSRRDIGHGALTEKSLEPVLPAVEDFPYTIRVVSEILESNGSSSMASVCGATLSLMDAGVPIKAPVAGVSIGMVSDGDRKLLLTDILGEEDFTGDMDFKVAGTKNGITGIQMDMKLKAGLDLETVSQALAQAREARIEILAEIAKAIEAPRSELSRYAPRLETVKIDPEKIGKIIGPGGKTINAMQAKYEVSIDVEDDGTVFVAGTNVKGVEEALEEIRGLTEDVKVGTVYTGKVVNIRDFGAFVELTPGQDGLCHVSELAEEYVKNVSDVVKLGDTIKVKVISIDDQGRVKLSRKVVLREEKGGGGSPSPERGGRRPRSDKK